MKTEADGLEFSRSSLEARRAKRIILCVMGVLMLLPLVLVWLTGSLGF